jgi:septal ring factor EnvC (AmiA/AmiB activator)
MPGKLAALSAEWNDLSKRFQQVVPQTSKLIMQYYNPSSGAWRRLLEMHAMLGQRLAALGVADAADPAAADDDEVKTLLAEIVETKAQCRRLSQEFWQLAPTVNQMLTDFKDLKEALDKVIKEKSSVFKSSKSVDELKALRGVVNTTWVDFRAALRDDPMPKPDDPNIN